MSALPSNSAFDGAATQRRLVLVTGPSGAGRSSALNVLEDAGFEAIDNLPLRLLPQVLEPPEDLRPLAIGIDARTREFAADQVIGTLSGLSERKNTRAELLYLDCARDVLLRRFSETRRRHPMAGGGAPSAGIDSEVSLLGPLKDRADVLIDTTGLTIHDLRAEVERWFAPGGQHHLTVSVQSFSYKRGLPPGADLVFDCRFLRNPHWDETLRPQNGTDPRVAQYVSADPRYIAFEQKTFDMVTFLLPAFREEGKSIATIAFGCTGGKHRSVTLAAAHSLRLAQQGWQVSTRHRELERKQEQQADP